MQSIAKCGTILPSILCTRITREMWEATPPGRDSTPKILQNLIL